MFRERFGCHRLLLVAVGMRLEHPSTGRPLAIETRVDTDFREVAESLGMPRCVLAGL